MEVYGKPVPHPILFMGRHASNFLLIAKDKRMEMVLSQRNVLSVNFLRI